MFKFFYKQVWPFLHVVSWFCCSLFFVMLVFTSFWHYHVWRTSLLPPYDYLRFKMFLKKEVLSNISYFVSLFRPLLQTGIKLPLLESLTLRLLMSYIYGAPSKARNPNVVYIWTYVWQRWNSLFLFATQCFNTESMQRGFLCHICV